MLLRLGRLLEQRGIDPPEVLAAAQVAPDPAADARVPYAAVDDAIERTAARLGAAGLGLALAQVRDDAAYGAAGLLLLASDSLRQGLRLAFAYQRIWGDGERFTLSPVRDGIAVGFRHPGWSELARAVLAECALAETLGGARALVDPHAKPLEVEFAHAALGDDSVLVDYFGVVPSYGGTANTIVLAAELVDQPLGLRGELLRSVFEQQCRHALGQLSERSSVAQRVRRLIGEFLEGPVGIAQVSARLRMSHRTLQRKLRAEGTSFQALVDGVRRARADALIASGAPKKEAALRIGYSDPSGFLRARRRWRSE